MRTSRPIGWALLLAVLWTGSATAQIKTGDDPEASAIWKKVRTSLFQDRRIRPVTDGLITLDAPARAEDAAVVPIAIRTALGPADKRRIEAIYLVIDNNPSPISAIFRFTAEAGRADIDTRVRVDEYTHVRAIAETSDGELHMTTRWVKASGGCSAPPSKDASAALATLGRMKLRLVSDMATDRPVAAQLMISHPNSSGLAMDQSTRQYAPPRFVRKVDVSYAGRPVMSADVDFSISENPNFRFYFTPHGGGELKAEISDSEGASFESALALPAPG